MASCATRSLLAAYIADEQKAAQNIDFAENADEPLLLQHRQAAKVARQHVLRGQNDISFRAHGGHVSGHAGGDGGRPHIEHDFSLGRAASAGVTRRRSRSVIKPTRRSSDSTGRWRIR